ncbi:hypothetical protein BGZ83_003996 [Gryganskiella cystojenkinii]|nr:hypothetical protein BGZ83_003996 [Gryganskiella cystojenkinii]
MQETQSFRVLGKDNVEEIPCFHVDGQYIVYWEDIEQVFPQIRHVKNGRVTITLARDLNRIRIVPHCIKHHPGVVLDVILSSGDHAHIDSSMATPSLARVDIRDHTPTDTPTIIPPANPPTNTQTDTPTAATTRSQTNTPTENPAGCLINSRAHLHCKGSIIDVLHAHPPLSSSSIGSEASSAVTLTDAVSSLDVAAKTSADSLLTESRQTFQSTVINRLDGLCDQGAKTQRIAQDIWKLQKQMDDRLILIQSRTEAILNQQLELAEYPIPRLFIVLPEELAKYDPGNWFRTKFRLHFICECGKHTETSNSKEPHYLHLAKHEGYLIREPTVFFKKYGPFLMLMLELIKFGTSIAGHVVPALASLKVIELVDSVQRTVETVTAQIDYSLECIDKQLGKAQASYPGDPTDTAFHTAMMHQDLANYLSDVQGLEGAELRQLGSFLTTSKEDNLLGNLYRMTTSDGHVKWVCQDHYRAGYQEAHIQRLREVLKLQRGQFDEQLGRITITLKSSFAATEFFNAFNKARGVVELAVDLTNECSRNDLEGLEDALKRSRVSILRLGLQELRASFGSKLLSATARYNALSRIRQFPNMKIIHFVLPRDAIKTLSFPSKKSSHLCKLYVDMHPRLFGEKELQVLSEELKTDSILTTLNMQGNSISDNGARTLAKALKTNMTLTTLNLQGNSINDSGAQALAKALKTNITLTALNLQGNSINDNGAQALATALKTNRALTTLDLWENSISDNGAQALAEALMANSTLTSLNLCKNSVGNNGVKVLAEALKTNSTLISLDVSVNSISNNGAQALAEALKTNSTLTTLNLQGNSIKDNGAQALAEALKTNLTLTTLDLWGNLINDYGARALAEALKANSTLISLTLWENLFADNGAQALIEALQINVTCKID